MKFIRQLFLFSSSYLFFIFSSCTNPGSTTDKGNTAGPPKTEWVKLPGKRPMLLLTDRPINAETPLKYFLEDFTPNDVFFVRWHLANLPPSIDSVKFRLNITGNVDKELTLSLNDLRTKFKPCTVNALCICAGNGRGFFTPHVPGVQWDNGGMGNAKWTGVRLKDILDSAGVKTDSKYISFNGMDSPPLPATPDFVKSLVYDHAMDGEVMIAYEMNGQPIPYLNGYPLKLVVPGWYGTYWIGMLNEIKCYADTFKGYWMNTAYLIPKGELNGNEKPDSLKKQLIPINKIDVSSLFVSPEPDSTLRIGKEYEIQGLAFDGGDGITKVEISQDSGKTWSPAALDASLGNYSWRRWRYKFTPVQGGVFSFFLKATNSTGQTQPWHQWNRSGFMKNGIESLALKAE